MGYDVHITRRAQWSDKGDDITLGEWIAFIEASPDMNLTGYAETKVAGGEILRIAAEGLTKWTGYASRSERAALRGSIIQEARSASRIPMPRY